MKKILLFTFLFTFLLSNSSNANTLNLTLEEQKYLDSKSFISATSLEDFYPFNFVKNGNNLGYSVDTMRLIGKILDKEIKFIDKPWNEQLQMVKNGELDIIPHVAINEKRKVFIDYTNFDHLVFSTGFVINKNNSLHSIKDLFNKTISVTKGSYLHSYLRENFPKIKLLLTRTSREALKATIDNRAVATIGNIPTLNYLIEEKWLTNFKIDSVSDFNKSLEVKMPMGVSKGNVLLKSIIEKAHAAIPNSEILKLKQNWMRTENNGNVISNLSKQEIAYLKDKGKILMCVLPDWLPFEQIDENGKHKGIGADVIKIVSKYINAPIELLPTENWSQSLQNIADRKCDILPVAMDIPSRRSKMDFTDPYVKEPFVVATTSDKFFIKDVSELSNKKIGIVRSYAFIEVLKFKNPSVIIMEVENTKEGLAKVSSGELDGYIDTMPTIAYGIQKYSLLDLKIAGKLDFDITLSIATRNDEPDLKSIMQKALNTISDEKRRAIVGRWISIEVAQEFNYRLLWQTSFAFLFIIFAVLYRNRVISIVNTKFEEQKKMVDKYVLISTVDIKGVIIDVNDAFCHTIGYKSDELIGKTYSLLRHPKVANDFFKKMKEALDEENIWRGEVINLTKAGETIYFYETIETIFEKNKKIGYRSICENITDKKKIEALSVTDPLTQLFNRLKIEDVFKLEIERANRYKKPLSVIIVDIDYFKLVNDTYGHDIGDEVLKSISKILKENIRSTDTLGRWGGEEFIILVPETNKDQTTLLAEKIRISIEIYKFSKIKNLTASFGVSSFTQDDTKESLIKKADNALYKAKEMGRNRVESFSIT